MPWVKVESIEKPDSLLENSVEDPFIEVVCCGQPSRFCTASPCCAGTVTCTLIQGPIVSREVIRENEDVRFTALKLSEDAKRKLSTDGATLKPEKKP